MQIIQDFKEWYKATTDANRKEKELQKYRDSITEFCDSKKFFNNTHKTEIFLQAVKFAHAHDDFEKGRNLWDKYSNEYHASSCFYRLCKSVFGLKMYIKPNQVMECINVHDKGTIREKHCEGCSHFEELVKYQLLSSAFKEAKQKQQLAKQKLLNNFALQK